MVAFIKTPYIIGLKVKIKFLYSHLNIWNVDISNCSCRIYYINGVLPGAAKKIAKIILKFIKRYLQGLIDKGQASFRSGSSCSNAI